MRYWTEINIKHRIDKFKIIIKFFDKKKQNVSEISVKICFVYCTTYTKQFILYNT